MDLEKRYIDKKGRDERNERKGRKGRNGIPRWLQVGTPLTPNYDDIRRPSIIRPLESLWEDTIQPIVRRFKKQLVITVCKHGAGRSLILSKEEWEALPRERRETNIPHNNIADFTDEDVAFSTAVFENIMIVVKKMSADPERKRAKEIFKMIDIASVGDKKKLLNPFRPEDTQDIATNVAVAAFMAYEYKDPKMDVEEMRIYARRIQTAIRILLLPVFSPRHQRNQPSSTPSSTP